VEETSVCASRVPALVLVREVRTKVEA